jgi:glycosyltransferase involved in cell wall biosynthesis
MQKSKKLKLIMLMSNLEDLGVQRVVINIYKHLPEDIEPIIVFWQRDGKVSDFFIPKGKVFETDNNIFPVKSIYRLFTYLRIIKKENPDVILSFIPGTNVPLSLISGLIPSSIKLLASEHAFLTRAFLTGEYDSAFGKIYKKMIPFMYNKVFDKLIMTAYAGKDDAIKNWGIFESNIKVIYNPQDIDDINIRSLEQIHDKWFEGSTPIIIAAGRLSPQKGFDKLLEAFYILRKSKEAKLAILGRGELEQTLALRIKQLGLEKDIKLFGFQINHLKFFKNSSMFVLSSVWEAMPMVVCESMVVGLPIVSFDCPSGPKELLNDGERGYLVENQNIIELSKTMIYVLENYDEAKIKAKAAQKWAKDNLNAQFITNQYIELIKSSLYDKN